MSGGRLIQHKLATWSVLIVLVLYFSAPEVLGAENTGEVELESAASLSRVQAEFESRQLFVLGRNRYYQYRDPEGAVKLLERAHQLSPADTEILALLQHICQQHRIKSEYIVPSSGTEHTFRNRSGDGWRWFLNGITAFREGDYVQAIHCFEQAQNLSPTEVAPRFWIIESKKNLTILELKYTEEDIVKQYETPGDLLSFQELNRRINSLQSHPQFNLNDSRIWYSNARYLLYERKDPARSLLALEISLLYDEENESARELKQTITDRLEQLKAERQQQVRDSISAQQPRDEEFVVGEVIEVEEIRFIEVEELTAPVSSTKDRAGRGREAPFNLEEFLPGFRRGQLNPASKNGSLDADREKDLNNDYQYDFDFDFLSESADDKTSNLAQPGLMVEVREMGKMDLARTQRPDRITEKFRRELKDYLARQFGEAEKYLAAGDSLAANRTLERAFLTVLKYFPRDLRANLSLMKLYSAEQSYHLAEIQFYNILDIVNSRDPEFLADPRSAEAQALVDCYLKQMVVYSAWRSYNDKIGRMSPQAFSLKELQKRKLLAQVSSEHPLELELTSEVKGQTNKTIWPITSYQCSSRGRISILPSGIVSCSHHGTSPILMKRHDMLVSSEDRSIH